MAQYTQQRGHKSDFVHHRNIKNIKIIPGDDSACKNHKDSGPIYHITQKVIFTNFGCTKKMGVTQKSDFCIIEAVKCKNDARKWFGMQKHNDRHAISTIAR